MREDHHTERNDDVLADDLPGRNPLGPGDEETEAGQQQQAPDDAEDDRAIKRREDARIFWLYALVGRCVAPDLCSDKFDFLSLIFERSNGSGNPFGEIAF